MQKKITLFGFTEICSAQNIGTFIFASVNQPKAKADGTFAVKLAFDHISVSYCPDTVVFLCTFGHLKISRINYILYDDSVGHVFTFVCGGHCSEERENRYVFCSYERQKNNIAISGKKD